MKHLLPSMVLMLTSPAFAEVFLINGGLGASSSFIDGARSLSDNSPSLGGDVQFTYPIQSDFMRVFLRGDANGVKYGSARTLIRPEVGGLFSISALKLEVSVRQSLNYGGNSPGARARDFNASTLFIRGYALSGITKLYGEVSQNLSNPVGANGYDVGWKLGIERSFIDPKLTLGSNINWRHYDVLDTNRYINTKIYARYQLYPKVTLLALKAFGGQGAGPVRIPSPGMVGVYYSY